LAGGALDPGTTTVRLHDAAGDRQSQPNPPPIARAGLPKLGKDGAQLRRGDAGSGVVDAEDELAVEVLRLQAHSLPTLRELQRVHQQVGKDAQELLEVEPDLGQTGI